MSDYIINTCPVAQLIVMDFWKTTNTNMSIVNKLEFLPVMFTDLVTPFSLGKILDAFPT